MIVEISYRTADGKRLFPDTYFIKREKALKYPEMKVKGVDLRIIPITDLEVYRGKQIMAKDRFGKTVKYFVF